MKNIEFYRDELSLEIHENIHCKICMLARNKGKLVMESHLFCPFEKSCPDDKEMIDFLLEEHTEPIELTDDERTILKNVDEEYKYIARDKGGSLNLFEAKTLKISDVEEWFSVGDTEYEHFPFANMFKFISWKDDEPYFIADLLEVGQK